MKILYVEDHPAQSDIMKQTLELLGGYDVILAKTGEEGIEKAQQEHPDIILMDLRMPGIGGITAIKRLKSDPVVSNIPVIVLSAWGSRRHREEARQAGAAKYLVKGTVDLNLLIDEINKLIPSEDGQT